MVRRPRRLEDVQLDIFEAIKRAVIRRGYIPNRGRQKTLSVKEENIKHIDGDTLVVAEKTLQGSEELLNLTTDAQDTLFQANTVFPFVLFTDTVALDREKLTITKRQFFLVAKIVSIPIAEILRVEANVGPFFGSVHISSRFFSSKTMAINFLTRHDAVELQRILQGYIIAHQKGIDSADVDKEQLVVLLNDLGEGSSAIHQDDKTGKQEG